MRTKRIDAIEIARVVGGVVRVAKSQEVSTKATWVMVRREEQIR
jgi:hypothetical protein